jgi:catechol 2,3-dioxygenase-like lactoylglutathione lyase family enzyme
MVRATVTVLLLSAGLLGCKSNKPSPLLELAHASVEHAELSRAIPILNVRSLRASLAYYRDVLGFKVEWEHGEPPDFGSVSRGDTTIFMCEGCQGNPGTWMMVFSRDVNALHEEFTARKALVRMPPKDMPWRLREMHVSDPDGNVIRFASHTDH